MSTYLKEPHTFVVRPPSPLAVIFTTLAAADIMAGRMLLLDGLSGRQRVIKLRPRRGDCTVCGDEPTQQGYIGRGAECLLPPIRTSCY